jgi:uncharacterized protein
MKETKDNGEGRIRFRVRVQPSASKNELLGWNAAGELRIRIAAPAEKGKANSELLSFLAKRFARAKSDIRIESGENSRVKTISAPSSIDEALRGLPKL